MRSACAYNQEPVGLAVGGQETCDFGLSFLYIYVHVWRVAFGGELEAGAWSSITWSLDDFFLSFYFVKVLYRRCWLTEAGVGRQEKLSCLA